MIWLWLWELETVDGEPKTTLRISDSLEKLTELSKALLVVVVYYGERLFKINTRKRCIGQDPGETWHKIPIVLFQWSPQAMLNSLNNNVRQHE